RRKPELPQVAFEFRQQSYVVFRHFRSIRADPYLVVKAVLTGAATGERTMLNQIKGLHHVTSMASSAPQNNAFWTKTLGLRRVKQTVNFDEPSVYHLYYGDEVGAPGSVMTYFPFPHMVRGRPGTGEVGTTVLSV